MKTNRKCTYTTSVWIQWWTRRPSDRQRKGGGRWGHCLWLTQGGSAFKSLHHLHWFPFLRSGGFKDLHSCDVKREKRGRKSRTRAGDGGLSPPRSSSSPTASSLPVTQARQKGWGGLCEARLGWCHQTRDLLQNRSEHECLMLCLCHYNPRRRSFNASKHANTIIRTVWDEAAWCSNTLTIITLMRSTPKQQFTPAAGRRSHTLLVTVFVYMYIIL